MRAFAVLLASVVLAACSSARAPSAGPEADAAPGADASTPDAGAAEAGADAAPAIDEGLPPVDLTGPIGGARPARVVLPEGAGPHPLIVLLHGYGASGEIQDAYLRLSEFAGKQGYVVATPDGTMNTLGKRFWNATDACCDAFGTGVDDVAYVRDLVRQVVARHAVDPARVYLFGHSNGGFLALRLACEESRRFAAVVALAGATWSDPARCAPAAPLGVLTIHGTADETIAYGGGVLPTSKGDVAYPSAAVTLATFADRNGCGRDATRGAPFDLDSTVGGLETTPARHEGCRPGGAAELWTIDGGGHIPAFTGELVPRVLAFLERHRR